MDRATQLANEIKQIAEQYKKEVSSSRRTWPLSIRERVVELRNLGLSCSKVSQMTCIPEPTVWVWTSKKDLRQKKTEPRFLPIEVASAVKDLTVKPDVGIPNKEKKATFQVELPGGIQVQNMDLQSLMELSRRMSQ